MTARQKINQPRRADILPDGYSGNNIPADFNEVPPVGIADVDFAIFNTFDKVIGFQVEQNSQLTKIPVVFAGGERFARVKNIQRNKPIRDRNGAIILPIISIKRTAIDVETNFMGGRGLGQSTGDLAIKKRLSDKDPAYQSIVNKALLQNQDNVATPNHFLDAANQQGSKPGTFATRRPQYQTLRRHATGEILPSDLGNNIFEVITIPFPQFFTATYEVVFWAQYIKHMNEMIEKLLNVPLFQVNSLRIDTNKGYWFVAYIEDSIPSGDNFEDYTEQERIIRHTFTIKVPAYMVAPRNPGDLNPFRRYLSAPQISFELEDGDWIEPQTESPIGSGNIDKFILNDVQELDKSGNPVLQSEGIKTRLAQKIIRDPFTGKERITFVQVIDRNKRTGETVANSQLIHRIDDIFL